MTIPPQVELDPGLLFLTFALLGVAYLVALLASAKSFSLRSVNRPDHLNWRLAGIALSLLIGAGLISIADGPARTLERTGLRPSSQWSGTS
jgi:hypothetical protein